MIDDMLFTRRGAICTTLAATAAVAMSPGAEAATGAPGDWAFLVGNWKVRHRKLRARLAGSTDWDLFDGTCVNWAVLGGAGNMDDNVLDTPAGAYRGLGVRAFDPASGLWSIWWLDSRFPTKIDVPVRGTFRDGVGTFVGDDIFQGKPIKMRFMWSRITATTARWEQAFSPDGGATWETNWTMEFTRA